MTPRRPAHRERCPLIARSLPGQQPPQPLRAPDVVHLSRHTGGRHHEPVEQLPRGAAQGRQAGLEEGKADLGDVLDAVISELGMPRSLRDVGVGEDRMELLAEHSLHDEWCKKNPRPLTEKGQVLEILEMVKG